MLPNVKSFIPSPAGIGKVFVAVVILATIAAFVPPVRNLMSNGLAGLMPRKQS